jgi:hypothetical protein
MCPVLLHPFGIAKRGQLSALLVPLEAQEHLFGNQRSPVALSFIEAQEHLFGNQRRQTRRTSALSPWHMPSPLSHTKASHLPLIASHHLPLIASDPTRLLRLYPLPQPPPLPSFCTPSIRHGCVHLRPFFSLLLDHRGLPAAIPTPPPRQEIYQTGPLTSVSLSRDALACLSL